MTLRARGVLALPTLILAASCGAFSSDDTPPAPPPPGDERAKENAAPPVEGAPLDGIFVSSSRGDDAREGTPLAPVATLAAAMQRAKATGKRVIACAEEYREQLALIDGVSLYGYFECAGDTWKKIERRATVRSPVSPALVGEGLRLSARVEGFVVVAPDLANGPANGESSIGARLRDVKGLALSLLEVRAGTAASGADGAPPASQPTPPGASAKGTDSIPQGITCDPLGVQGCSGIVKKAGPPGGTHTCAVGANPGPGGYGGDGKYFTDLGVSPEGHDWRGKPLDETPETRAGAPTQASVGPGGLEGAAGADGASGKWGYAPDGTLLEGLGAAGQVGAPGQGGGGGGGRRDYMCPGGACSPIIPFDAPNRHYWCATGGGGGAGGCGGIPGEPGKGGGASVALLSVASEISIERTTLRAAKGGKGGAGHAGTLGGAGGLGGYPSTYGGGGGAGGRGGPAGLSGHGATGPSIALVFSGPRPKEVEVTFDKGTPGDGQPEVTRVQNAITQTLPATKGEALEVHEIK